MQEAVERLSVSGAEKRGAISTRREVVDFILDLVGYSPDMPLYERKILEPSFGEGAFLVPIVERLLDAYGRRPAPQRGVVEILGDCIRAVELNDETFRATRERLEGIMSDAGLAMLEVDSLLNQWLVQGDFLLEDLPFSFEYVVGNPPYVRQELIPDILIQEYRRRFHYHLRPRRPLHSIHRKVPAPACPRWSVGLHMRRPLDEEPVWCSPEESGCQTIPSEVLRGHDRYPGIPLRGQCISCRDRNLQ